MALFTDDVCGEDYANRFDEDGIGFHLNKVPFSWEMPSTCVKAYKQGLLAPVQKAACKRNLALMPVLVSASRKVSEVCQETFQRHRWNCSSIDLAPRFGQDIIRGTSEQAFVSSLAAAGLAIGVGRACAEGRIKTCGCGRESREPPPSDFKWGGCADNIGYGVKAAKAFSSEPFDRRKFRANVDVRLHRHNSRVGWRSTTSCTKHRRMSERGETDSRSIGSSEKFHATAVRRNVVNHQIR
ncbi:protein Wnt-11 [Trichonephila clavipes]|uniref:Protein Wnt n=1 Tax=Trichonephila clavipes TaxID=2585209 RepID=A0A8X7BM73_TRICX|nr:protein Wnt-11 [Trichonephila clavipes]